jgi:hypothetical protein
MSEAVVQGRESARSIMFLGSVQGNLVLILLDFGSSYSFISVSVAENWMGSLSWLLLCR